MHVCGLHAGRGPSELLVRRHAHVRSGRAVPRGANGALLAPLGDGLPGPRSGHDVVRGQAGRPEQVHRDHGELQARSALAEQDAMVLRQAEELSQAGRGPLEHVLEQRRSVADLEDRHARAVDLEDAAGGLLEHRWRERRGSRGEVPDASAHAPIFPRSRRFAHRAGLGCRLHRVVVASGRGVSQDRGRRRRLLLRGARARGGERTRAGLRREVDGRSRLRGPSGRGPRRGRGRGREGGGRQGHRRARRGSRRDGDARLGGAQGHGAPRLRGERAGPVGAPRHRERSVSGIPSSPVRCAHRGGA